MTDGKIEMQKKYPRQDTKTAVIHCTGRRDKQKSQTKESRTACK